MFAENSQPKSLLQVKRKRRLGLMSTDDKNPAITSLYGNKNFKSKDVFTKAEVIAFIAQTSNTAFEFKTDLTTRNTALLKEFSYRARVTVTPQEISFTVNELTLQIDLVLFLSKTGDLPTIRYGDSYEHLTKTKQFLKIPILGTGKHVILLNDCSAVGYLNYSIPFRSLLHSELSLKHLIEHPRSRAAVFGSISKSNLWSSVISTEIKNQAFFKEYVLLDTFFSLIYRIETKIIWAKEFTFYPSDKEAIGELSKIRDFGPDVSDQLAAQITGLCDFFLLNTLNDQNILEKISSIKPFAKVMTGAFCLPGIRAQQKNLTSIS